MKFSKNKFRKIFLWIAILPTVNPLSAKVLEHADSVGKAINLEEIVVKAALVKHDAQSDEYTLTPKLTEGVASVYDVFSRLPGVTYNSLNNSVSVRMDNNTLIEVNGNRVSPDYVRALPLNRISRIQIIYAPSARYSTEGIRYVINIKLKNDFEGHDLYIGNYTMVSAGDNNGKNVIANEQPKVQYIFSGKKVDITAGYGFASINWNYPFSYSRTYNGIASITTSAVTAKKPNDHNSTRSHAANLGFDWQLSRKQTLSLRGTFQSDIIKHNSDYEIATSLPIQQAIENYFESSYNKSRPNNIATAIYYKGIFGNGWSIYSALSYDRVSDNINSLYEIQALSDVSRHRNAKDYFRGILDLNYSFSDNLSLNFGYQSISNRYLTHACENERLLSKYAEQRHNSYVFFDWSPKESILLHIGTGIESILKKGIDDKRNWLEFLPQVTFTWQTSENVQFMAEYAVNMDYPSLYQVSEAPTIIDRWLTQTGNSLLSPSREETASLQATFFDNLIVGAEYTHTHNSITDWYEKLTSDSFTKTFKNARNREFKVVVGYDWAIFKGLTWNNIIQWQWQKVNGENLASDATNLLWQSKMEYWHKPIGLLAKIEYSRQMQKIPLLQGYQHYGQDLWLISLQKSFLNKSLSVSLNYIPPFHFGVRANQNSQITTSFLTLYDNLKLRTYDNLLMIRVQWRFNKGRHKKRQIQDYDFSTEQKQNKGLL
jgi:hypothetical protein